jgi:hypothetical protein
LRRAAPDHADDVSDDLMMTKRGDIELSSRSTRTRFHRKAPRIYARVTDTNALHGALAGSDTHHDTRASARVDPDGNLTLLGSHLP